MSRFSHIDILVELVDLSREVMAEISHELQYYQASVYKTETADRINLRIAQLRLVAEVIGGTNLQEPFADHDAMAAAGVMNYVPGQCSFSVRVTRLMKSLDEQLQSISRRLATSRDEIAGIADLPRKVQDRRRELLSLCRHGSRQQVFFQTI
jgi:hypothetical protein